jgi:DNA modification methylase
MFAAKQQRLPISKLKNNSGQIPGLPKNPRLIKDERFSKLVKSLQDDPEMLDLREVIAYEYNGELIVIAGNMRLKACQELGIKEVPTKILPADTPLEKLKAYTIKDNVPYGENDWDALANEWDMDMLKDWGMEIPDLKDLELEAKEDDFEIPDEVHTDIVPGDLFEIGPHRLLCGDSTNTDDFLKLIGNEKFDLIVTDPPYNVDYTGKTKNALKIENDKMSDGDFKQFLYDHFTSIGLSSKDGAVYYIFQPDKQIHNFLSAFLEAGNKYSGLLIWKKDSMVMSRGDYHAKHETITYGWKEGSAHGWYSDRKQTSVLEFERPKRNAEHPTMKPIPLLAYLISNSSKSGDLVGDGFGGSGSTMVAAHQLNRRAYLMELDPKYCAVIIARMRTLVPDIPIKRNGQDYTPPAIK